MRVPPAVAAAREYSRKRANLSVTSADDGVSRQIEVLL
jgi:hypothetical protein